MHFLGIDYGSRRVGLAFGDELGVATPLPALVEADPRKRWERLGEVIKGRKVDKIVIGLPLNMDGSEGFKAAEVRAFADKIQTDFHLPVHFIDERLTSHMAESGMSQKQLREIRSKGIIDSRAATIILQDYMDELFPALPVGPGEELD